MQIPKYKVRLMLASFLVLFVALGIEAETINGMQVKRHVGQIVMINPDQGTIQVRLLDEQGIGNWTTDSRTEVSSANTVAASTLLQGEVVRVWVTGSGYVLKALILKMHP